MNKKTTSTIFVLSLMMITGCASAPESDPAYVAPTHYANYNCNQISSEMQRISTKMEQAKQANTTGKVLDTALAAFAISQGYGYSSDNDDVQYRRLVNQYDVLEQTAIQKECGLLSLPINSNL